MAASLGAGAPSCHQLRLRNGVQLLCPHAAVSHTAPTTATATTTATHQAHGTHPPAAFMAATLLRPLPRSRTVATLVCHTSTLKARVACIGFCFRVSSQFCFDDTMSVASTRTPHGRSHGHSHIHIHDHSHNHSHSHIHNHAHHPQPHARLYSPSSAAPVATQGVDRDTWSPRARSTLFIGVDPDPRHPPAPTDRPLDAPAMTPTRRLAGAAPRAASAASNARRVGASRKPWARNAAATSPAPMPQSP